MICGVTVGGNFLGRQPCLRDNLFIPIGHKSGVITALREGMLMRVYNHLPGFQHTQVSSEGGRTVLPRRAARGLHSKRGCHLIEGQE